MSRTTPPRRRIPTLKLVDPSAWDKAYLFWDWLYTSVDYAVDAWINRPRIGDTKPGGKVVTFKPRDHFRANGTAKIHRTEADAKQYCAANPEYHAYKCTVCQDWHVAHKPKRRRKIAS